MLSNAATGTMLHQGHQHPLVNSCSTFAYKLEVELYISSMITDFHPLGISLSMVSIDNDGRHKMLTDAKGRGKGSVPSIMCFSLIDLYQIHIREC